MKMFSSRTELDRAVKVRSGYFYLILKFRALNTFLPGEAIRDRDDPLPDCIGFFKSRGPVRDCARPQRLLISVLAHSSHQ